MVKLLLTYGAQISIHSNALTEACINKNLSMVNILIPYVYDVSIFNDALNLACKDINIVKLLLTCVNHISPIAINSACIIGDIEIIKLFKEYGADVTIGFFNAVNQGHLDLVDLLISWGTDINNIDNIKAFECCIYRGMYDIVYLLIKRGFNLNQCQQSIIDRACVCGDMRMIELLWNGGINFTIESLTLGAKSGNLDLVKFIFDNIAPQKSYASALKEACYYGHQDVMKFFISIGEKCDVYCSYNDMFCGSVMRGYITTLKLLVENDDVKSLIEIHGASALHYAIKYDKLDVVKYLIELGADVNSMSNVHPPIFPIVLAVSEGHANIVQLLIDNSANLELNSDLLELSVKSGSLSTIKILIANGFDIHKNNERVLQLAINNGFYDMADYLLTIGADINNQHVIMNTALLCQLTILYYYGNVKSLRPAVDIYYILMNGDVTEHNDIFLQSKNKSTYYEFIKKFVSENTDSKFLLDSLYYVLERVTNIDNVLTQNDIFILSCINN
jgi:ankyrin repeat protein